MIGFAQYVALVAVILLAAVIFVLVYGIVARELHTLVSLIEGKRKDRKIFKTAERCRDDFA